MRILLLAGAGSIHSVRWANAFVSLGHEVHLVAVNDHKVKKDKIDESVVIHYLRFSSPWGYYLNALELYLLCKKIKPDVINAHYASGYGTLVRMAHIHPYVLSVWGSDVYDFPFQSKINFRTVQRNLEQADAIASTSYVMTNQIRKILKTKNKVIAVTPFGVDIHEFSNEIQPAPKNDNTFLFGTIKKLTYKYGIDYIIKGFDLFLKEWKKKGSVGKIPHLYICGKGENKEDFEKLRDSLGLGEYIDIEGYIAHEVVASKFRSFDVSVFGSELDSESFGVSAVESMACGTPVIATDVDGFTEVVKNGSTGFIVPRKNAKAIAEKMSELYYNDNMRFDFGRNGRMHVIELYDWNKNIKELEKVLIDIVSKYNDI